MKTLIGLTGFKKKRTTVLGCGRFSPSSRIALAEVKGTRLLSHKMWHRRGTWMRREYESSTSPFKNMFRI